MENLYLPPISPCKTHPFDTPSLYSLSAFLCLLCCSTLHWYSSITAGLPTGHKKNLLLLCTSSIYRYTLFLHPFSRSLFYPISICDSPPFDTPLFPSTLLLYAPYPTSSLSSHSTYNSLTHPTLRLPLLSTLPLFTPSLHSFTIHTPLISSSLPSASTPFSTISTAQSPLGSPLVTRQPPYMTGYKSTPPYD